MKLNSEMVIVDEKVYHLGLRPEQLASNILLVGDPARAYKVANHFDQITHEITHREYITLTGYYHGLPCSVIGTGIGTDNVEIAIIEAYALLTMDFRSLRPKNNKPSITLIRVGTSGGIQPDIEAGTVAVTTYALGLDSTGLYYDHPAADQTVILIETESKKILDQCISLNSRFKNKIQPYASKASPEVAKLLNNHAIRLGLPAVSGITVSTPGFYGPSGRFIEGLHNTIPNIKNHLAAFELERMKMVNMEMESSLIFHLSQPLGIKAGTICPIISNPDSGTALVNYDKYIDQSIEIALLSMLDLANGITP